MEETYWLDTLAANLIRPPLRPAGAIESGRQPLDSRYLIWLPLALSASTRGPMGRCFILALPVMIVVAGPVSEGWTSVQTVVKNRAAVPALPRYISLPFGGTNRDPCPPWTTSVSPPSSHSKLSPCRKVKV